MEIGQFFQNLKTDISILNAGTDTSDDAKKARTSSVALRIIGLALLVIAAITLIMGLVAGTPAALFTAFLIAGIAVVVAHDSMVVGDNKSKELAALDNPAPAGQGLLARGAAIISSAVQVGGMVLNETVNDRPHALKGTWVFEPIYKCCRSK